MKGPDPPAAAMAIATKPHTYHLITKEAIDKAPTKTLQGLVRSINRHGVTPRHDGGDSKH